MPEDFDDKKVKELLDAATQSELAKWFALPSFEQVAEEGGAPPIDPEDPEMVAVRERREKAMAAVDPALLDAIAARTEARAETMIKNVYHLDIHVKEDVGLFDQAMAERQHQIAEPREVEISDELKDDLKDCTPQALLRDLHRPETFFEKQFEVIDWSAEQKLDIVAEVDAAMKMNLKLPPLGLSPFEEERRLLAQDRAQRKLPWADVKNRPVEGE
ncbi:MAG: hypothetical protein QM831_02300 [Kofleriaceae bacterium]